MRKKVDSNNVRHDGLRFLLFVRKSVFQLFIHYKEFFRGEDQKKEGVRLGVVALRWLRPANLPLGMDAGPKRL